MKKPRKHVDERGPTRRGPGLDRMATNADFPAIVKRTLKEQQRAVDEVEYIKHSWEDQKPVHGEPYPRPMTEAELEQYREENKGVLMPQELEEITKDDEIENVKPIVRLVEAVRGVMERDINLGLYTPETLRLTIDARKDVVKKLADQGLSTRQIGTIVGVSKSTVERDLETGPKRAKDRPKVGQLEQRIEEAKAEAREEVRQEYELKLKNQIAEAEQKGADDANLDDKQHIANLKIQIDEITENAANQLRERDRKFRIQEEELQRMKTELFETRVPPPTDFAKEIGQLTGPLVKFIQHDNLVHMLVELESQKEHRTDELDMREHERVIHALLSLAKRAQSWAERLTPTNDRWQLRTQSYFEKGNTL